jgi:hypothetical protein
MARVGKAKRLKRQARFARQRAAWWAKHAAAATQPDWQRGAWTEWPAQPPTDLDIRTMDIATGEELP